MPKIKAINHVSFRALDLAESIRFYEKVLGAKQIPNPNFGGTLAWMNLGPVQVHLFQRGEGYDIDTHFAVEPEDFMEVYDAAVEMNALDTIGTWGHWIFEVPSGNIQMYLRDPANNLIEVVNRSSDGLSDALKAQIKKRAEIVEQSDYNMRASLFLDEIEDVPS